MTVFVDKTFTVDEYYVKRVEACRKTMDGQQ